MKRILTIPFANCEKTSLVDLGDRLITFINDQGILSTLRVLDTDDMIIDGDKKQLVITLND